jgi:molecular chaperone HscB
MTYFELFELPVSLKVDKDLARRKYLELSRRYHPDYFVNHGEEERQNAVDASALLNKALQTFSSPDETIGYVLKEKGLLEEEEKYALPPDFLMEMMEVNEQLAELQMDEDPNARVRMQGELNEIEKQIYAPVQNIVEHYQEGVTTEKELLQVKDYYFRKKYLKRLREQLAGMQ